MEKGDIVKVYRDYQTEQEYMGAAELISKVTDGLPFVLQDSTTEDTQKTYSSERWYVKFISGGNKGICQNRNIRCLLFEGLYTTPEELYEEEEVIDKFNLLEELGECF